MEVVKTKIISSKGNLAAAIRYSEKKTDKLAILCPGYLDSKDYKHLISLAEVLSERGYTVVRFEPTGTWESEGNISEYTTTQYLKDIKNVLEYMLGQANYKHVLLGGHSRGGQVSILYTARDSKVSMVLGIMPSSGPITGQRREDWEKAGISVAQRDLPDDKDKKREFRVSFSHALDRDQYNAVEDVKKIKVPIILIAGELDKMVPPDGIRKIFDSANEPKKFIVIPGIGHDYRFNDDEIKIVNQHILDQLDNLLN
ncbi:MAG: hypothetical protein UV36_C0006G0006 [Parcubacteria group bacterium GW2011_GWC2_42_6]|nr:MAG: hypothetical protein UV36_C0006G0006 [Parcubacteria group bacterium GW2011_GWC2_42_6]